MNLGSRLALLAYGVIAYGLAMPYFTTEMRARADSPKPLLENAQPERTPIRISAGDKEGRQRTADAIQVLLEACPNLRTVWDGIAEAEAVHWPVWNGAASQRHGWRTAVDLFVTAKEHVHRPAGLIKAVDEGTIFGYRPEHKITLRYTLGAGDQPGILADGTVEQALCGWSLHQEREDGDFFHAVPEMAVLR